MVKIKVKSINQAVEYLKMAYFENLKYDLQIGFDEVKGQKKSYYTVAIGTDEETFKELTGRRGLYRYEMIAKE